MINTKKLLDNQHLFIMAVRLDQIGVSENRSVYGWLDVLGDLGGVMEIILLAFGFFLYPFSEHSFILNAANSLFYASTKLEGVFKEKEEHKVKRAKEMAKLHEKGIITQKELEEINTHHKV